MAKFLIFFSIGIASTAGVSAISYNYFTQPFIARELKKRDFQLLSSKTDQGWDIRFNESKTDEKKYKDKNELIERCYKIIWENFKDADDSTFIEAKKFCTKPETIKEKAKREGKRILNTNGENEEWKKNVKKYQSTTWNTYHVSINKSTGNVVLRNDMNERKLQIWCENTEDEYFLEENTNKYTSYKELCTKN